MTELKGMKELKAYHQISLELLKNFCRLPEGGRLETVDACVTLYVSMGGCCCSRPVKKLAKNIALLIAAKDGIWVDEIVIDDVHHAIAVA